MKNKSIFVNNDFLTLLKVFMVLHKQEVPTLSASKIYILHIPFLFSTK